MSAERGLVLDIQRFCVHDGPGIRTTVFLKGCPLRCAWCQNPESILPKEQLLVHRSGCAACGACVAVCPEPLTVPGGVSPTCTVCGNCVTACPQAIRQVAGRTMTVGAVTRAALRDRPFYGREGGVTFGGGEPLAQWPFVRRVARTLRTEGVHVAVDTCGYISRETAEETARDIDLLICDLKFRSDELHRRWTGVGNDRILQALKYWSTTVPDHLWISIPLIPKVHTPQEIEAMAAFLAGLPAPPPVRLIPYHETGAGKYSSLALPPPGFPGDVAVLVGLAERILAAAGLTILPGQP